MKLGLVVEFSEREMSVPLDLVKEAERVGFDAVFTPEAYGADAITPLTWIAAHTTKIKLGTAIMQAPARSPAMTAMTAMTLDAMSGGRFLLGLGPSGPQVVEGWHGVAYRPPLGRLKEYIAVVRAILRREAPAAYDGSYYSLPYRGDDATGLGKPLKSILHGRADMKIYTAAITPGGVRTAAEAADGFFPIWTDPERLDVFEPYIRDGLAKRGAGGVARGDFEILPFVNVVMGDDLNACYDKLRPQLALYVSGMGAREKNFYNELVQKYGFEAEAKEIQDLFLDGKRKEAAAAVPDALVDAVALCGSRARITDRIARWKESATTTLCARVSRPEEVRMLAEVVG